MMTNVMVKTCLNQKIIKNSNFIQAMKNSVCPTANVTRSPIFSESRIFRIVDSTSTHDMIIVKWQLLNFSKAELVRIFTECLPNVYRMVLPNVPLPNVPKCGLNTRHDNREVTLTHLTRAKLCALTNAQPVQSTQTGQWLSTLFHAKCSAAQVSVLYPRQFIFAPSSRRRPFLQVLQSTQR